MQNLTPTAARMKAIRDKKAAMTADRKKKKAQNQREDRRDGTVGDGKDRHHKSDGTTEVVSIKDNRGNFGNGTKNE
tara:strand:- start:875 stop:1102 length:228 start_codon:yes stop_codon:yes gene_type:complete